MRRALYITLVILWLLLAVGWARRGEATNSLICIAIASVYLTRKADDAP